MRFRWYFSVFSSPLSWVLTVPAVSAFVSTVVPICPCVPGGLAFNSFKYLKVPWQLREIWSSVQKSSCCIVLQQVKGCISLWRLYSLSAIITAWSVKQIIFFSFVCYLVSTDRIIMLNRNGLSDFPLPDSHCCGYLFCQHIINIFDFVLVFNSVFWLYTYWSTFFFKNI